MQKILFFIFMCCLRFCCVAGAALPLAAFPFFGSRVGAAQLDIRVSFITREVPALGFEAETPPPPPKGGLEGARLGFLDNAATGRFSGQSWVLGERSVPEDGRLLDAVKAALDAGERYLIIDAPADEVLAAADLAKTAGGLVFNSGAPDTRLREADCRANLFHTLPSRDMLADALMQYLAKKRWSHLLLVRGPEAGDGLLADAFRASAVKFRLKVVAEKIWADPTDGRTASQEIPVLTQAGDYDVVVVADETRDFGRQFPYATWLPRPVAGSTGLTPTAWNDRVRGWAAAQIQDRFMKINGRAMDAYDYAAFMAVRALGEAVTRSGSTEPGTIAAALTAPAFALGGYKGAMATFRPWNRQLRQPIALTHGEGVTAFAPIPGFEHRVTELDTLGRDAPETKCPFPSPE
ncbi:ABC transporter substrate-binding protein [Xanthobacter autotrophicus]|uniref:ABC transporter substrate-binding protein n=1 Tax=Xanthobacter autotrophicus TaxID=280 RepID=UPI0024A623D3|nr:ABC transporter substrate-binding protein [Xanthobacter autotrophicus]MDI4657379.1 ABC transporter substrate-binding protein [Xanthobacter autotrophicus]